MRAAIISTNSVKNRLARLVTVVIALGIIGGACALLAWLLWPTSSLPPAKVPFGLAREAAPITTGLGGYLLALQGRFYQSMTNAVVMVKENHAALWPLIGIGFVYGVFHAAGPGHGKGVISAYLVASERSLKKGLWICLAAALLQAIVAIAIVTIAALLLNATAREMTSWSNLIETGSFAIVAGLGLLMSWRKAGKLLALVNLWRGQPSDPSALACDHVHLPPPDDIDRMHLWRDRLAVVFAAGTRPCSGALIILIFTLSQGLFIVGIAATFAMALGTAITTGLIASLAVFAKALALRLASGRGGFSPIIIATFELAAAAFVAVLGLSLLFGLWFMAAGS